MQLVRVEWIDAASQAEWTYREGLIKPMDVTTSGFKVADEDNYIVICASFTDNAAFGDCIAIPKGLILKEEILRAGTP